MNVDPIPQERIAAVSQARVVRYCKTCIMPDSRPRIVFDESGVCNACRQAEAKTRIDWEARYAELVELTETHRSTTGSWDCIVPWSGGKDSSTIAYRLKFQFGMNPLLVTFSPLLPNKVGARNREALIQLGFDHIYIRPNQKVHRYLSRRFFVERGNHKVPWDAGVNAIPVKLAVRFGIPLVFYAEHGESEYGGRVLSPESTKVRDFTEVIEHQIGDDPRNWIDDVVTEADLNPYVYPALEEVEAIGVKALYFSHFLRWSMYDNFKFISTKLSFERHPAGRTPGTFTDFDSLDDKADDLYYYMQYAKFGFGRTVRDACRFIQNGHLSRDEALELARMYDGEFPDLYLDEMLDYLDLTRQELDEIVDLHRNSELWRRDNGEFELIYPPH
jgi:N-acetyl sugar amidotransferase